ncbi:MAG: hypothetical protein ACOCR1_05590, partial [Planctomycetota bacterium]
MSAKSAGMGGALRKRFAQVGFMIVGDARQRAASGADAGGATFRGCLLPMTVHRSLMTDPAQIP